MSRRFWLAIVMIASIVAVISSTDSAFFSTVKSGDFWRQQVSPGALSVAHSFLNSECSACHVSLKSVPADRCIACHSDEPELLQSENTAFHKTIGSCTGCHREHEGKSVLRPPMNHQILGQIAIQQQAVKEDVKGLQLLDQLNTWLTKGPHVLPENSQLSREENQLRCVACHQTKDRHLSLFGKECGACHGTVAWALIDFRHPAASSRDCNQCHQGPPSHYMEHFSMISMRVAGKPHAKVDQCYLCHQTTTWNDIRGVGFYDHH